jgi:galactokinase
MHLEKGVGLSKHNAIIIIIIIIVYMHNNNKKPSERIMHIVHIIL